MALSEKQQAMQLVSSLPWVLAMQESKLWPDEIATLNKALGIAMRLSK